jgi:hypothetical protein
MISLPSFMIYKQFFAMNRNLESVTGFLGVYVSDLIHRHELSEVITLLFARVKVKRQITVFELTNKYFRNLFFS